MKKLRRYKEAIAAIAAVTLLYLLLFSLGITCPIKYITGISCAGCGMTRACIHLVQGDIDGAFSYHPLVFIPFLMIPAFIFRRRIPERIKKLLIAAVCLAFLTVYVIRLTDPNDSVVTFHPEDGAFVRFFTWLTG